MIQKFGSEGIQQLYELKRADLLAQNKIYYYILSDYDKQKNYYYQNINELNFSV